MLVFFFFCLLFLDWLLFRGSSWVNSGKGFFNLFAAVSGTPKNHQTGGFFETLGLLVWPNFPWI